jgi:hypothetical protein
MGPRVLVQEPEAACAVGGALRAVRRFSARRCQLFTFWETINQFPNFNDSVINPIKFSPLLSMLREGDRVMTLTPHEALRARYRFIADWVPVEASQYLAHVADGLSLRRIARADGLAPSTICRRVRRMEARRDDPLVDEALDALRPTHPGGAHRNDRPTGDQRHDRAVSIPDCFR